VNHKIASKRDWAVDEASVVDQCRCMRTSLKSSRPDVRMDTVVDEDAPCRFFQPPLIRHPFAHCKRIDCALIDEITAGWSGELLLDSLKNASRLLGLGRGHNQGHERHCQYVTHKVVSQKTLQRGAVSLRILDVFCTQIGCGVHHEFWKSSRSRGEVLGGDLGAG
jgi:hypothetical protein